MRQTYKWKFCFYINIFWNFCIIKHISIFLFLFYVETLSCGFLSEVPDDTTAWNWREKTIAENTIIFSAISFTSEYYSSKMLHTKSVLAMFHYFLSEFALYNYILKTKEGTSPLGNEHLLAFAFIARFYTRKHFWLLKMLVILRCFPYLI